MNLPTDAPGHVTEGMLPGIVRQALRARLPKSWAVDSSDAASSPVPGFDAGLTIVAPDNSLVRIGIEVRLLVEPRDVQRLIERLAPNGDDALWDIALVAARYLSAATQERLKIAGLSFVDATGNIYLRSDHPPIFISARGRDHDPWRGPGRPRGTLKGAPAAHVVRALLDAPGPWRMRELITAADTSTGSVYRVIEFLESDALAVRNDLDGTISVPQWANLLRRWAADYKFLTTNVVSRWIAPRGIESAIQAAAESKAVEYAVTGSVAAQSWAAYAPARSLMAYTMDPRRTAEAWGLRETDSGANVLLAEPAYPVLTQGAHPRPDGLVIAAPIQVAVDLLEGPGRAPTEAEALIDWMVSHEPDWR